jgi:hypothetical protein
MYKKFLSLLMILAACSLWPLLAFAVTSLADFVQIFPFWSCA